MANTAWCQRFPDYSVINGPPRHSDHRSVIVCTQGEGRSTGRAARGFRFEAWWLKEEGCAAEVQGAWEEGCMKERGDVATAMTNVARRMRKWSREVVGELEGRLRKAGRELETCMRAPVSAAKVRGEARLRCLVEELEDKKNTKAKQYSHVTWLWDGNKSTKYFMAVASAKRKANQIKKLSREDGSEVKEGEELTNNGCSFF